MKLVIEEIQIVPIHPQNGLVGFASAAINNQFYVGNIAVYTAPNSKLGYRLVFPTKKLANGKHVECFYPINQEAEQEITRAVIKEYRKLMEKFNHIECL